jgi:magnesium-transporting ATPase (P-type)
MVSEVSPPPSSKRSWKDAWFEAGKIINQLAAHFAVTIFIVILAEMADRILSTLHPPRGPSIQISNWTIVLQQVLFAIDMVAVVLFASMVIVYIVSVVVQEAKQWFS